MLIGWWARTRGSVWKCTNGRFRLLTRVRGPKTGFAAAELLRSLDTGGSDTDPAEHDWPEQRAVRRVDKFLRDDVVGDVERRAFSIPKGD
jgi:hypothetical protein